MYSLRATNKKGCYQSFFTKCKTNQNWHKARERIELCYAICIRRSNSVSARDRTTMQLNYIIFKNRSTLQWAANLFLVHIPNNKHKSDQSRKTKKKTISIKYNIAGNTVIYISPPSLSSLNCRHHTTRLPNNNIQIRKKTSLLRKN